ncbi:hypothetical protein Pelo_19836 [Pelomyxa schiedti]|nr:hypothetical protein Pelo_19836 [Pelomyxa schiedti]
MADMLSLMNRSIAPSTLEILEIDGSFVNILFLVPIPEFDTTAHDVERVGIHVRAVEKHPDPPELCLCPCIVNTEPLPWVSTSGRAVAQCNPRPSGLAQ